MKETKNNIKEAISKAMEEIAKKRKAKLEEEEEEVLIEPFLLLDPEMVEEIGELHEFTNLSDVVHPEACPSVDESVDMEIHEDDILYEEIKEDPFIPTESLLDIADEIKPLDADNIILCDVGGNERILVNGENCNIRRIPLLKLVLLTPPNIQILDNIMISGNTTNIEEIEVEVLCSVNGQHIVAASNIGSLVVVGLLAVLIDDEEETIPTYSCSPIEWRGLVKRVDLEELENLFNN